MTERDSAETKGPKTEETKSGSSKPHRSRSSRQSSRPSDSRSKSPSDEKKKSPSSSSSKETPARSRSSKSGKTGSGSGSKSPTRSSSGRTRDSGSSSSRPSSSRSPRPSSSRSRDESSHRPSSRTRESLTSGSRRPSISPRPSISRPRGSGSYGPRTSSHRGSCSSPHRSSLSPRRPSGSRSSSAASLLGSDKEDEEDENQEAATNTEEAAAEDNKPKENKSEEKQPEPSADAAPSVTLLDRLGGAAVLKGLVFKFYQRLLEDTALKPFFKGINLQRLRDHQYQFMTRVFSGVAPEGWDPATLIVTKHQMLFDKGLNQHHFDLVGGHWQDTMVASKKIDQETIQEIMASILPLRPIFEVRAKVLNGHKALMLSKLGNEANVKQALYNMYGKMASDPLLEPLIQGVSMAKIQNHQFKFLEVALTEIPLDYDIVEFLQSKHARLFRTKVVEAKHFDRMVQCLVEALKEVGVNQRDIDDARNTICPLRSVFDVGPPEEEEPKEQPSEADSQKVSLGLLFGTAAALTTKKQEASNKQANEEDEEEEGETASQGANEQYENSEVEGEEYLADTMGIDLESDEEEEEHSTISPDETKEADHKVEEQQTAVAKPSSTNYGGLASKLSGVVLTQEANDQAKNAASALYQMGTKALFQPAKRKQQEAKEILEEEKQEAGYGGFASRVNRLATKITFAQDDYFAEMDMRFETKVIAAQKQEYDPSLSSASFMTESVSSYQLRKIKKKRETAALNAELEYLMAGGGIDDD